MLALQETVTLCPDALAVGTLPAGAVVASVYAEPVPEASQAAEATAVNTRQPMSDRQENPPYGLRAHGRRGGYEKGAGAQLDPRHSSVRVVR